MLTIKRLMTQYVPGMLTCKEFDQFLYDFHEGNLTIFENLIFKMHLSMCSECKVYLDGYRKAIQASKVGFTKTYSSEKVPEELIEVILKSRTLKNQDIKNVND